MTNLDRGTNLLWLSSFYAR